MNENPKIPTISEELIKYLDGLFPDKCADLKDTDKEIFYKSLTKSLNHCYLKTYDEFFFKIFKVIIQNVSIRAFNCQ